MDSISHMPSPRSLSNHFHCWINLFGCSFHRSISVILVLFLVVIWRPKKSFSSKSCSVLLKIRGASSMLSSQIVSNHVILFLPIRSIPGVVFRFDYPEAFILEYFFVPSFQLRSPIILNWCHYVRLHIRTGALLKNSHNRKQLWG